MQAPVRIGITTTLPYEEAVLAGTEPYRDMAALTRAGATALVIPNDESIFDAVESLSLDGILFGGGDDMAPELYGGNRALIVGDPDDARDRRELDLFKRCYEERLPILAVCRGMQLANVAFSGTLIEDIATELGDRYNIVHAQMAERALNRDEYIHEVVVEAGSRLEKAVGRARFRVNSIHHQAIQTLARPFRTAAHSLDGIIEAIEPRDDRYPFFLGVQWHPEALPSDDPVSQHLYDNFVAACRAQRLLHDR